MGRAGILGVVRTIPASPRSEAAPLSPAAGHSSQQHGDRLLLLLILAVGALRPTQALVRHETWHAEAVLGLLMTVFAARALIADLLSSFTPGKRRD